MGLAAMAVKNIADVMRFAWAAVAIRYRLVLLDVAFVPLASVSLIPRITGARIAPPRAVLEGIKGASSSSVTQAAYPSPVGVLPKNAKHNSAIRFPSCVRIIVPEIRMAETTSHVVEFANPEKAVCRLIYESSERVSAKTSAERDINTRGAIGSGRRMNPMIVAIKTIKIRQPESDNPVGGATVHKIKANPMQSAKRIPSDFDIRSK